MKANLAAISANRQHPTHTMQIQTKHLLTMLVMAGISLVALPAKAAMTYTEGDLLLAFRASTGSNTVLTVDLGQASQFVNAGLTGATISSVVNLGSILDDTYGTAWRTGDATLNWAVAEANSNNIISSGGRTDPYDTIYYSRGQTTDNPGIQSSAAGGPFGASTMGSSENNIVGAQATFQGGTAIANTYADNTKISAISNATTTWDNNVVSGFGLGGTAEGNLVNGADASNLDLYRLLQDNTGSNPAGTVGVPSYLGSFTLNSTTGVVGFSGNSVAAAPEPSRALLAALGLGGLIFRRRRSLKA